MLLFGTTVIVGTGKGEIRGKTVGEVIENLCDVKGAEFRIALFEKGTNRINDQYVIFVNGKPIDSTRELNRTVKKGDIIAISPALGGG